MRKPDLQSRLIYIGPFGSEGTPEFVLLMHLLDESGIKYSVFGRHYLYSEGGNGGVRVAIHSDDY